MGSAVGKVLPGFPIPNLVLVLFVPAVVASLVLSKTSLGRYTFALGSNEEATRLSGVNVERWKIAVYAVSGFSPGSAASSCARASTRRSPRSGLATSWTPSPRR